MRDLSIILRVSPLVPPRLGLVDLDLKPLSKVPSYLSQDIRYFTTYANYL